MDEQFSLGAEFDQNPFAAFVGGGQPAQQPQQAPEQGMNPAMMGGMMADPAEDQTQKGVNPGTSKFLIGAMQQLQGYVAESQDRDEIAIARSIMQLLTRLIDRDQQNQADKLGQEVQPAQPQVGGQQ